MKPKCSVPSCTNSVKCGGLCAAHYYERSAADTSRPMLAVLIPDERAEASRA